MEQHYITYEQVEDWVMKYYKHYGRRTDFLTAVKHLYETSLSLHSDPVSTSPSVLPASSASTALPDRKHWQQLSRPAFFEVMRQLPVNTPFWNHPSRAGIIFAESIMPSELEVYALRYVRDIVEKLHIHNFFEINYVLSGSCQMSFEQEVRTLWEGDFCIIAPGSHHDVTLTDDSQVVSLMLRQTTFDTTFFNLMAQDDLLASFLRTILYSDATEPGYLLFSTNNSEELFQAIRDIFMECYLPDRYSNTCVISRVHLLFSLLLRNNGETIQFYETPRHSGRHNSRNHHHSGEIPTLLQYIQNHYQTITLESLAEEFHYSPSYLSRLIKKRTGRTLVEILTHLKLSRASYLLLHTSLRISDIARLVGYDNVDHFSRQFRKHMGTAPREYRGKLSF